MSVVIDASAVVALLVDTGEDGAWAEAASIGQELVTPHLMPVETTNILRRSTIAGRLSADAATLAIGELADMPVALVPFRPFSDRVWELRETVTAYDAWYAALAESLDAPLLTLDRRLARASGLNCQVLTPR